MREESASGMQTPEQVDPCSGRASWIEVLLPALSSSAGELSCGKRGAARFHFRQLASLLAFPGTTVPVRPHHQASRRTARAIPPLSARPRLLVMRFGALHRSFFSSSSASRCASSVFCVFFFSLHMVETREEREGEGDQGDGKERR